MSPSIFLFSPSFRPFQTKPKDKRGARPPSSTQRIMMMMIDDSPSKRAKKRENYHYASPVVRSPKPGSPIVVMIGEDLHALQPPPHPRRTRRGGPIDFPQRAVGELTVHRVFLVGPALVLFFFFFLVLVVLLILLLGFIITPIVLGLAAGEDARRDADDEVEPEDVDALQARQQGEGDVLRDPALVLLRRPVELKGPHAREAGRDRVQDDDVEVVAQVDPGGHEDDEVRVYDAELEVRCDFGGLWGGGWLARVLMNLRERKGWSGGGGVGQEKCISADGQKMGEMGVGGSYSEEEVANIVGDIHRQSHVGEVESVAQPYQSQRDDVMGDQLLEVSPRLLEHQAEHNGLLTPVASLQQVVGLEERVVGAVREGLVHADGVEVPDRRAVHDPQAVGTEYGKVQGGVRLFHEAVLLRACPQSEPVGEWAEDELHDEFAGEG